MFAWFWDSKGVLLRKGTHLEEENVEWKDECGHLGAERDSSKKERTRAVHASCHYIGTHFVPHFFTLLFYRLFNFYSNANRFVVLMVAL